MSEDNKLWTVFAVHSDTGENYVTYVEAPSAHEAWRRAQAEAPGNIRRAGVVEGRVEDATGEPSGLTPIRRHEKFVTVAAVRVTERSIMLPSACPQCSRDIHKPGSVMSYDLIRRLWKGHLTFEGNTVAAEKDQDTQDGRVTVVPSARLTCGSCGYMYWDGLKRVDTM